MKKKKRLRLHQALTMVSVLGDLLIINLLIARYWLADAILVLGGTWPWALVLASLSWITLAWMFHLNPASRYLGRKFLSARVSACTAILLFVILLGHIGLNRNITLSLDFLYFSTALLALLLLWNLSIHSLIRALRSRGFDQRKVVVAGAGAGVSKLTAYFRSQAALGYTYAGYLDDTQHGATWLGRLDDLRQVCRSQEIDELVLDLSILNQTAREKLKSAAQDMHLQVTLLPDIEGFHAFRQIYHHLDQTPIISLGSSPLQLLPNRWIKRSIDLLLSSAGILFVFSWLGPLIMLGIRISSPGPVFFRQKRTGYHNRTFTMLKFRTMFTSTDAETLQAQRNDPRTTAFGRVLRRTSLDELPQLFNVMAGQMSLIGPRPHMLHHTEVFDAAIPRYLYRHHVKPGMTGLAQVRGLRGEVAGTEEMKARIEQDIYFIEHWSLLLDMRIALLTLWRIIRGDDKAY